MNPPHIAAAIHHMLNIKKSMFIKKIISFAAALAIACAAAGCAPAADAPDIAPAASASSAQSSTAPAQGTAPQKQPEKSAKPNEAELRAEAATELEILRESATYGEELAFFFKEYGSVLTEAQADDALAILEGVLEREQVLLASDYEYANADDTFKEAFKNGFFRQNTYLLSEELRALVEGTLLDGFKLLKRGDELVPVVDYAALLARYGELCSAEYREYLEICAALPDFALTQERADARALADSIAALSAHSEKYAGGITESRARAMLDILEGTNSN